jgi:hypothetical protein
MEREGEMEKRVRRGSGCMIIAWLGGGPARGRKAWP